MTPREQPGSGGPNNRTRAISNWPGISASILFFLIGVILVPYPGIQNDEALISYPLYLSPGGTNGLMANTYLGALKSFLLAPIFDVFGANEWSVRLPALLFAAGSIFVFYRLCAEFRRPTAGWLGAFVLATSPTFLLTATFDWGPVALEHLLIITACWALYRYGAPVLFQNGPPGSIWYLSWGFFLLGLAMWNKAIVSWILAGLALGAVVVFPVQLMRLIPLNRQGLGRIGVATAAFLVGSAPLIAYNLSWDFATFRNNTHLSIANMEGKWPQARSTTNGDSLFAYMVGESWFPDPRPVSTPPGEVAEWIVETFGEHRSSGFYTILGVLLVALPLWWKSRAAWFSIVVCATGWFLMAITKDAGGAAHHVILLWPFPVLFAVSALTSPLLMRPGSTSGASKVLRSIPVLAGVCICVANLLVINQHLYQFERFGSGDVFTDAMYPLTERLGQLYEAEAPEKIITTDWGMDYTLALVYRGELPIDFVGDTLSVAEPGSDEVERIAERMAEPNAIWVAHTDGHDVFPNVGEHLKQIEEEKGFTRKDVEFIRDSNRRPMFEIFRFARVPEAEPEPPAPGPAPEAP